MSDRLTPMIGCEHAPDDLNRALRDRVRDQHAPVVGAMHITCADESEFECVQSFQRVVVNDLLPELKFACRTAFQLANLGSRYEEGALAVAEHHFATPAAKRGFKVMLVKVNAHVAVKGCGATAFYGRMDRYDAESAACGALHAMLDGKELPALAELRATFVRGGVDRVAALNDMARVLPVHRGLFAAIANASLQTQRVVADIEGHEAHSPTLYLVASCVTLNRPEQDTELLCGLATLDHRVSSRPRTYVGLGDDPTRYEVQYDLDRVSVMERGAD